MGSNVARLLDGVPFAEASVSTAPLGSSWSVTDHDAIVEPEAAVMLALIAVPAATVVPSSGVRLEMVGGAVPVEAGGGGAGRGMFQLTVTKFDTARRPSMKADAVMVSVPGFAPV